MGIFSDEDINAVDKLVKKYAGRTKFLKAFEAGYKETKSNPQLNTIERLVKSLEQITLISQKPIENFGDQNTMNL